MAAQTEIRVEGECAPRFAGVREALDRNFRDHGEIGSAVAVYHRGQKVVDLWGGHMEQGRVRPWRQDTLCLMYSIAKSMCALSVHMLADRGLVDLEAPVATYWPGFAAHGKGSIKVRHILSHNCGVWQNDASNPGDMYDWDRMIAVLERQAPAWPVETQGAYNTINIGFLTGEVVRRVTGKRVQDFIHSEICSPLGATYFLGVPEDKLALCADLTAHPSDMVRAGQREPGSPAYRAAKCFPQPFGVEQQNGREFRMGGVPSIAGFGEARAMARIYACLAEGGEIDGVRLLSKAAIERATVRQWSGMDYLLKRPNSFGMGFMRNPPDGMPVFGPRDDAFGHTGSGGARAFAVPSQRLSVCFVSNYQSEQRSFGVRTEAIVKAACEAA